jgi:hypothetical protein
MRKLQAGPVAVYDPYGHLQEFDALYDMSSVKVTDVFVQNLADIGKERQGHHAKPVTAMRSTEAKIIFVACFDMARILSHFRHLVPEGATLLSLDELRLPEDMLTSRRNYLDTLNFATNFALFRDTNGLHTRIVTANYWAGYDAKNTSLWLRLFSADGKPLATWREQLKPGVHTISIDSKEVRNRFGLEAFTGSLFCHAIGVAGHDVVKYALDTYGDADTVLSCTHDSNAWPADLYAGVPAPKQDE